MTTKKKWAIGIGVFLALGLLGAVLDDGKGSATSEVKTESQQSAQTEQKQETEAKRQAQEEAKRQAQQQKEEADRQAREQKEKESQLAQKKKEVEEKAYKAGYSHGLRQGPVTYSRDNPKDAARIYFNTAYGIPSSSEEKDMLNLFLEHYVKGYHDGYKSKEE